MIVDHFDGIKNQIDVNIETLIGHTCIDEYGKILKMKKIENDEDRKSLNDKRKAIGKNGRVPTGMFVSTEHTW